MKTSDFSYDLPEELIAQTPAQPRDSSRLLVYHRDSGEIEHRVFRDVIDYLNPGDVLVVNQTRVIPARLYGVAFAGKNVRFTVENGVLTVRGVEEYRRDR